MANSSLVSSKLLSTPAFVRDLTSFLNLSEAALLAIAEFGNESNSFVGRAQSHALATRFDVPNSEASGVLRVAKYLYDRVTELNVEIGEATNEIDSIAAGLDPAIIISGLQRNAIESILAYKRDYEISEASSKALADAPHYSDVNGSWGVKLLQTRTGENIKVPVIALNLTWHDGSGEHHETFVQMGDEDWDDFENRVKELASRRAYLNEFLQATVSET